jgi:hypothetical protein
MSEQSTAIAAYMDRLVRAAFDAGFAASGEGWNGEYPGNAQDDPHYAAMKELEIERVLETVPTA